jgi:hypothetical protein
MGGFKLSIDGKLEMEQQTMNGWLQRSVVIAKK